MGQALHLFIGEQTHPYQFHSMADQGGAGSPGDQGSKARNSWKKVIWKGLSVQPIKCNSEEDSERLNRKRAQDESDSFSSKKQKYDAAHDVAGCSSYSNGATTTHMPSHNSYDHKVGPPSVISHNEGSVSTSLPISAASSSTFHICDINSNTFLQEQLSPDGVFPRQQVNISQSTSGCSDLDLLQTDSDDLSHSENDLSEEYIISPKHINDLPYSILLRIFRFIPLYDLLHNVCLVNKFWREICQDSDFWRIINLRGQCKVDDGVLERVTLLSRNVTEVDITDSRLVTSEGVIKLAKACPKLRVLKTIRCQNLTDPAFVAVGEHCHELRRLHVDCCWAISDRGLEKVALGCCHLTHLWLNQCPRITNAGVKNLARNCHKLKLLSLDFCQEVSDACFEELTEGCPALEVLNLMSCNVTDVGALHLKKLKKLRNLELANLKEVSHISVVAIAKACPLLESLNLCLCTSINDACVESIARHARNLSSLQCVSCNLSDKALESIAQFSPNIRVVDVGWCQKISNDGVKKISTLCKDLRFLGLMRCDNVTSELMEDLVVRYPRIHYSTAYLDVKRLLDRAKDEGCMAAIQNGTRA